jgi:hypothetical protein
VKIHVSVHVVSLMVQVSMLVSSHMSVGMNIVVRFMMG